ncbi:hypothetical protein LSTR_LSTR010115 [Laodelphax striatellus]|uniref:Uncharacterized protein n=1 Tax=Laodelphax striatellus TaxID=195883 RepID=A0A482WIU8_LAOST|nr:hypothetical protein LSTR_LSTR010115 [Laodelphax striatellus]
MNCEGWNGNNIPGATQFREQTVFFVMTERVIRVAYEWDVMADRQPDLIYYWSHTEAVNAVPPTPGKLQPVSWPPPLSPTASLQDVVLQYNGSGSIGGGGSVKGSTDHRPQAVGQVTQAGRYHRRHDIRGAAVEAAQNYSSSAVVVRGMSGGGATEENMVDDVIGVEKEMCDNKGHGDDGTW